MSRAKERARKLAERQQRKGRLGVKHAALLPPADVQARIAEAVHRTMSEPLAQRKVATVGGGPGMCQMYNAVGASVASAVLGCRYLLQAGSLYLKPDPKDPGLLFAFDCRDRGLERGEFHCWFALDTSAAPGISPATELVDLSSRLYKALVNNLPQIGVPCRWRRPDPPPYIWTAGKNQEWVTFEVHSPTTTLILAQVRLHAEHYNELHRSAMWHYAELAGAA